MLLSYAGYLLQFKSSGLPRARGTSADPLRYSLLGPPRTILSLSSSGCFHFFHITLPLSMRRDRIRPDPVSCQLCRSKKLKCNRVQPCSNCSARGTTCNFLVPPQGRTDTTSTIHSNAELLGRIKRLEAIIQRPLSVETYAKYASDDSYLTRRLALTPSPRRVIVSDIHQSREEDSQLLENVGTREDSLVCDSDLDVLQDLLPAHSSLTFD